MDKTFDQAAFVNRLGEQLIEEFSGAGFATTPHGVGSARESSARAKLEHLLPAGVGVSSGHVIDSYGSTSKQVDIVIYERDICPIFSISDPPEPGSTYFPCEGVIAVGEVKSSLDKRELDNAAANIASVQRLQRYAEEEYDVVEDRGDCVQFRFYGSRMGLSGTPEQDYNQATKSADRIMGFVLAGELGVSSSTLASQLASHIGSAYTEWATDTVAILKEGVFVPVMINEGGDADNAYLAHSHDEGKPDGLANVTNPHSFSDGDGIYYVSVDGLRASSTTVLGVMIAEVYYAFYNRRTVSVRAFQEYFVEGGLPGGGVVYR